jgi:hypothetical protein
MSCFQKKEWNADGTYRQVGIMDEADRRCRFNGIKMDDIPIAIGNAFKTDFTGHACMTGKIITD